MTPEELKAIEDRCNAATPGPWERECFGNVAQVVLPEQCTCPHDAPDCLCAEFITHGPAPAAANADFIAHSRTNVISLATALREAWAEISRLQAINHYDMEIVKETRELCRQVRKFMNSLRPEDENSSTVSKEIT